MKSITTLVAILLFSAAGFAQSKSFVTLKQKFSGHKNVHSFHASGLLARIILLTAGEHEFLNAVKDIRSIRMIVIPRSAFRAQGVTPRGFIKLAKDDAFQELANVRDHGDDVTLLMQSPGKGKDNRYLLLVDNKSEVVAIEVKGYIDPKLMLNETGDLSYIE